MSDDVLRIVNRSNQRGGRMLSVTDLIAAETLSLELAAWLVERIEQGSSWLVGANPGGAGKTAVMGALLVMLPRGESVRITSGGSRWQSAGAGECVVAYEISPASFEAYIWGEECRRFAQLGLNGTRIVANLHADTCGEARSQLTGDNGLTEQEADAFDLFVPIRMERSLSGVKRVVEQVHLFGDENGEVVGRSPGLSGRAQEIAEFLEASLERKVVRIEDLRREWLRSQE
jgi:hypothetical protein